MEGTMKLSYMKRTGHERTRLAKKGSNSAATGRRKRAMERLEAQFKAGTKPINADDGTLMDAPLDEKDKTRIAKEIEILKTRL